MGCGFGKGSWEEGLGVDLIEMEWAVVPQLALATHSPRQPRPHFNYHLMQCPGTFIFSLVLSPQILVVCEVIAPLSPL